MPSSKHRHRKPCRTFEQLETRTLMSGDPVLNWNEVALQAVADDYNPDTAPEQGGPGKTARALAIVHIAMFDAANSIEADYKPYAAFKPTTKPASIDAAVAQAAYDTLVALYPNKQAQFDTALEASLDEVPDGGFENRGVAIGHYVAKKILQLRSNDGSAINGDYSEGDDPGEHRPDPLHPGQPFLGPAWGSVKPFAMTHGSQFRSKAPPKLGSVAYAQAYNQVKTLGAIDAEANGDRTTEQTEIGIFWAYDGANGLGTPPRLYNQITRTIAVDQGNTVLENARLFALINVAQADAGIASWETKYTYDLWRPIVAIREGATDGNRLTTADPNWQPLGAPASNTNSGTGDFTPPFPAYTSGHATFGAATFQAIAAFYGTDDIEFDFMSDELNGITTDHNGLPREARTRHYDSLSEASWENAISRIYLGIHYSFDATAGITQGTAVANQVFNNFFRPANESGMHRLVDRVMSFALGVEQVTYAKAAAAESLASVNSSVTVTASTASTASPSGQTVHTTTVADAGPTSSSPRSTFAALEELFGRLSLDEGKLSKLLSAGRLV